MKPTDLRNATYTSIRQDLAGRLAEVYRAWVQHGPATTRRLAELSGIDILNVRPRTTDLVTIGLVELSGVNLGEGIYQARDQAGWERWANDQRGTPNGQLKLI